MSKGKWSERIPVNPEDLRLPEAAKLAHRIEVAYRRYGTLIKIKQGNRNPIREYGFEFQVKLKDGTSYEEVSRNTPNVQSDLRLKNIQLSQSGDIIYLHVSTPSSVPGPVDNNLAHIMESEYYKTVSKNMEIAHPIGINEHWRVMMCDLVKYPHAMICGTTMSGKSTALKCLLVSLIQYTPDKVNLLIAGRNAELDSFRGLPHLSYPLIYTPETLAYAILLLKEEMERRIVLEREDKDSFSNLPYIVFVVDEFQWFINEICNSQAIAHVVEVVNDILRCGRHSKIHLVLVIHDPKDDVAIIGKADIPARLIFQTTSARKSMTAMDSSGAEKLCGRGDMIFRWQAICEHLQGVYMSDEEISQRIATLQSRYSNSHSPRGEYGFTISEENIEKKKVENTKKLFESSTGERNRKGETETEKFTRTVLWVLSQAYVSANSIQNNCKISNKYATKFWGILLRQGIVDTEAKDKNRCKVMVHSPEEVPQELKERMGITDDMIRTAIKSRESTDSIQ